MKKEQKQQDNTEPSNVLCTLLCEVRELTSNFKKHTAFYTSEISIYDNDDDVDGRYFINKIDSINEQLKAYFT